MDVFNAPTDSAGVAGLEDSTVDTRTNSLSNSSPYDAHIYENVYNGNVAPTKMLCDSIAHKNNFMKRQLKFLLEHLSESYE